MQSKVLLAYSLWSGVSRYGAELYYSYHISAYQNLLHCNLHDSQDIESRTVIVIKEILNVNEFGIIPMILLFIISYQLPFLSG